MGLGKKRTALGEFLDQNKLSQLWLSQAAKVGRNIVSQLCDGQKKVQPYEATQIKIISALRKHGFDVRVGDFW